MWGEQTNRHLARWKGQVQWGGAGGQKRGGGLEVKA